MRTAACLALLLLSASSLAAEGQLVSPYRAQAQSSLRSLSDSEIAELRAGRGMGLARAAELNSYPGPRHVLDAVAAGQLSASAEQLRQLRGIFDTMSDEARRVGALILKEEEQLEATFRDRTIVERDLRERVARIAALQGELRVIHLRAHLLTRAVLSTDQIARYDELRGYTTGQPSHQEHHPMH
ncbi:MAG TPA: hypothetical protein VMS64_21685 [Candidatus Methylomirabilis sp.]|nr:hypothetical protein [Candidatus Methylomirabilis sp.]